MPSLLKGGHPAACDRWCVVAVQVFKLLRLPLFEWHSLPTPRKISSPLWPAGLA
ncbi:hypothetical protein D8674_006108 [Pyrus ussuriensis x Pyrus communis]|uniref:Uncharacterized protein n=1 Tax=Pyrus ussuriensis x Pyrus communis TaxID=2448454 RepID=A0A5N5FXS4_9ROSA|nr:hypothetical protein D8674_006108 [Pyrus ussuriensis x Pyrus communis]